MIGLEQDGPSGLREAILAARDERSGEEVFRELTELFGLAVSITTRFQQFLDTQPVICLAKFDGPPASDSEAGRLRMRLEPTEDLVRELAAVRALYAQGHAIGSR